MSDEVNNLPGAEPASTPMPKPVLLEEWIYDEEGKLTHDGMIALIESGRSFSWGNSIVTRLKDIPTDIQMAMGDKKKEAVAAQKIRDQISALNKQLPVDTGDLPGAHIGDTGVPSSSTMHGDTSEIVLGTTGQGDLAGLTSTNTQPGARRQPKTVLEQGGAPLTPTATNQGDGGESGTTDSGDTTKTTPDGAQP